MKKLGYAILGLGIGMAHAEAAAAHGGAELIAACDLRRDRLSTFAEAYPGVRTFSDFDEMLALPGIDILSVCLPSSMHADYAVRAMESGRHVLIEKPIDITLESAARIAETARRAGVRAGVVYQNRFNLNISAIKSALDVGLLGRPILADFAVKWFREQSYYDAGGEHGFAWHGTWAYDGGGSLINQAIHTLDLMLYLMGGVRSVSANWGIFGHKIETEDATASVLEFESGAIGTFISTTCAYPGVSTDIKIYGSGGTIEADADKLTRWEIRGADNNAAGETDMLERFGGGNRQAARKTAGSRWGHAAAVADIIEAITEERDPAVTPEEATRSLRLVLAIYKSARTGERVFLSDFK